jgi:CHAT domain-containing protein
VSDLGTLALMAEFYTQLAQMPTRGEALRQAQLALLKGESRFENGVLQTTRSAFTLTPELQDLAAIDLSHPFYWSAFTLIGGPW